MSGKKGASGRLRKTEIEKKKFVTTVRMKKEEKKMVRDMAKVAGFKSISAYIRHVLFLGVKK